jgi:hypothetical protein
VDRLSKELLIEALSMGKSTTPKHAKTRAASGLCLVPGCDAPQDSRGLCTCHKNRFQYVVRSLPTKREKLDFERDQIRKGLVLPSGDQGKIRKSLSCPFSGCGSQSA